MASCSWHTFSIVSSKIFFFKIVFFGKSLNSLNLLFQKWKNGTFLFFLLFSFCSLFLKNRLFSLLFGDFFRARWFFRLIFSETKNWSVPRCQRPTASVRFAPIASFRTARQKIARFGVTGLPWPWFSSSEWSLAPTSFLLLYKLACWNPAGRDNGIGRFHSGVVWNLLGIIDDSAKRGWKAKTSEWF